MSKVSKNVKNAKSAKVVNIEDDDDEFEASISSSDDEIGDDNDDTDDEIEEDGDIDDDDMDETNIIKPSNAGFDGEGDDQYEDLDEQYEDPVVEDDEPMEKYLQKINANMKTNIINDFHPQLKPHNYEEIQTMTKVQRNKYGDIEDDLHRTSPYLTKYERSRILAERTVQLDLGMQSFIDDMGVIDSYLIAVEELKQKKLPFIIKRPLPNGAFEYWNIMDLEFL
jgi:DNA-directed RNA polymerase I, II, and III subunit RPABC2